ncbi:MAG: hypothetical protein RSB41_00140 [Bacilli bacterium]
MKKSNKPVIILLSSFIVIFLVLGMLGLFQSIQSKEKTPVKKDFNINYKYYVDDIQVPILPVNAKDSTGKIEERYIYDRYTCTNRVEGIWDNTSWQFTPKLTADTTCKLYFKGNAFKVDFTLTNAILDASGDQITKTFINGSDATYKIIPTEKYTFDTAVCDEKNETSWDPKTNILTIKALKKNTKCEVKFKLNDFNVQAKANFGTITEENVSVKGGTNAVLNATAADGYVFNKVTCTNNQTASWGDNKLTVSNVTADTVCTIDFKQINHKVTLNVVNGNVLGSPATVLHGKSQQFAVNANPNFIETDPTISCTNNQVGTLTKNMFSIASVTADTVCTITFKEKK